MSAGEEPAVTPSWGSVRVNCGGADFTNAAGLVFQADRAYAPSNGWGFVGGQVGRAPRDAAVEGTDDDTLFLTERWGADEYRFIVRPGIYIVTFFFNDSFFSEAGRRVFDVLVNSNAVIRNLDIVERVGGQHALEVSRAVTADDGLIVVSAKERKDKAQFCAIAIEPARPDAEPPPAPGSIRTYPADGRIGLEWPAVPAFDLKEYRVYRADGATGEYLHAASAPRDEPFFVDAHVRNGCTFVYRISAVDLFDNESEPSAPVGAAAGPRPAGDLAFGVNIGGDACTDAKGRRFIADREYSPANGAGFIVSGHVLCDTNDLIREPMRSGREGRLVYRIDLPPGLYRVMLGFIDPWSGDEKDRVFSVHLNGWRAAHELDLLEQYGRGMPVEIERVFRVTKDEGLEIKLQARWGEPLMSFLFVEPVERDGHPPAKLAIRAPVARDGVAYLSWAPASEADVVGYQVLRAEERPIAFRPLGGLVGVNEFVDHSARNGGMYFYKVLAVDASGNESPASEQVRALPHFPEDEELLDIVSRAAFEYFARECDPKSYLTYDKSVSDVVSIAAAGFGLSALCIGAERGWMPRDEAEKRAYLMLRSMNYHQENKVNGLFFHFVDRDGSHSQKGYEDVVSTVDSALLMWGAIAAGEYFGGRVKSEADLMMGRMNWKAFADEKSRMVAMAYRADTGRYDGKWDFYTDEALLVMLLGIGAPNPEYRLTPDYFYTFARKRGSYKDIKDVVMSWSGALFTYTFAHCWLDFRRLGPDNPQAAGKPDDLKVDWWENTVKAIRANKEFCSFIATRYKSFGEHAWGLSASSGPDGRYIVAGAAPCGGAPDAGGGTLALYSAGMAVPFLPDEALAALRHYYSYRDAEGRKLLWRDEFEGGYGFIDSFNVDKDFFAKEVQGIDHGPMLLLIENHRTGLIWKLVLRNAAVRAALQRVGFAVPPAE